jgi:hypothetical protein
MTAKEKSELPAGAILRLSKPNQYMYAIVLGVMLDIGHVQCDLLPINRARYVDSLEGSSFFAFPIKGRAAHGWKITRIA